MTTVVVADDHTLVREGIHALLDRAGDIQVIGEAADGQEAVALVQKEFDIAWKGSDLKLQLSDL